MVSILMTSDLCLCRQHAHNRRRITCPISLCLCSSSINITSKWPAGSEHWQCQSNASTSIQTERRQFVCLHQSFVFSSSLLPSASHFSLLCTIVFSAAVSCRRKVVELASLESITCCVLAAWRCRSLISWRLCHTLRPLSACRRRH